MSPANENHSIEARHLATMLAARAMLAALKDVRDVVDTTSPVLLGFVQTQKNVAAAIAMAEAAGIESPANVIAASSDLAKGDAP